MLDFLFERRRMAIRRVLSNRINRACADRIRTGERHSARSTVCDVVWLIPGMSGRHNDFEHAVPVVCKDISTQGLAVIHTQEPTFTTAVIGLESESGLVFLRCTLQHTTRLGFGFVQIGLYPDEVIEVSRSQAAALEQRIAEFEVPHTAPAEQQTASSQDS